MKKILTVSVLVVLVILTVRSVAFSQTRTDICFDLTITDNCAGEWNGYYAARVTISFGNNEYCGTTIYNLSEGSNNNLSYSCFELPIQEEDPCYIINVTVCRQEQNPTCCGEDSTQLLDLEGITNCTASLSTTLN